MRTNAPLADSRPWGLESTYTNSIKRHKVLLIMNPRCAASSLEPFLGTYRIVWDSHSNYDPREALFDNDPRGDRDPDDGLLTLTYPQRSQAWPKEPVSASSVVLRICDSFLGTDRTASQLRPSPRPVLVSESSASLNLPGSSPKSLLSEPHSSPASSSCSSLLRPAPTPSLASTRSFSAGSPSPSPSPSPFPSSSDQEHQEHTRRFWRFDWDPSFPRLGFRFEGMDLTAARGHALSFSRIRDDAGRPFLVLDLRPTGWGASDAGEWAEGRSECYITVVAKRVADRYARGGLSEAERERLGMVELDEDGYPVYRS
ncbi:hypothetical protein BV20DRAFT_1049387 [Pilatotrama ljubarskyi]|nr:hypothetical protein BV20DRAFT_1049387 [Pilatotrama ljubarskyi]